MGSEQNLAYSVEAYNISHASENKIHDDAVAKKLGFSGGLVPGVEVFAYTSHPAVAHWGKAFLEQGQMACRFVKPVYDGRRAVVTGAITGSEMALILESEGVLCASGTASIPGDRPAIPEISSYKVVEPPSERPPADEASLAVGTDLTTLPVELTREINDTYLADVRERAGIYAAEGIAHPGYLLRLCNTDLFMN